jgi:hypothetical protein
MFAKWLIIGGSGRHKLRREFPARNLFLEPPRRLFVMSKIALAEMVEQLRSELRKAVDNGRGRDLNFEVLEITLEAQVQVMKEAEGKLGFWVFTELKGKVAQADVQKVVVKMRPIGPDGQSQKLERRG